MTRKTLPLGSASEIVAAKRDHSQIIAAVVA